MTLNEYINSLKNKSVAVIGIGVSNTPLIELLLNAGCNVTACDKRSFEELGEIGTKLKDKGAKFRLGDDYLENLTEDVIFRTPGLMPFDSHLDKAREQGSVVTSEMEVFFSLCPCKIIAVTGSDGKTTTTTIISELLKAAGYRVHLGGNIGNPLLSETPDIKPDDITVLELSSFQLHSMYCRPNVSVITNISPNHLDKHKDFKDYYDAKMSIFAYQGEKDKLVLNLNDEHTAYYEEQAKSSVVHFSDEKNVENGTALYDGILYRVHNGVKIPIMRVDEIKLPGRHNVQNYLAAFAATDGFVSEEVCRKVAMEFGGVEHRLELVRVLNGVTYINDSIASSPTRTTAGLNAMKQKPIVIAGGYDKHIPFDGLGDEFCLKVKKLFLTGDTAKKIYDAVTNSEFYKDSVIEIHMYDDFTEAVKAAAASAEEGDTVLFSPACASFDHFKNFAERGKYFKKIVMEL